jgi:hypothetical protein
MIFLITKRLTILKFLQSLTIRGTIQNLLIVAFRRFGIEFRLAAIGPGGDE